MTDRTLRLSHSTMNLFHNCERKFEFLKVYQGGEREESLATGTGHALHAGFQDWVTHGDAIRAHWAMMKEYPYAYEHTNKQGLRCLESCYATLEALVHSYGNTSYEIASLAIPGMQNVIPCVEVPFQLNIKGIEIEGFQRVIYVGKMDLILWDRQQGKFVVVDIKTHRQSEGDMSANYVFDTQCIPYSIVLEHVLGHEIDSFDVNYMSAYIDLEKPNVKPYQYTKTKQDVNDWARGLLLDLKNLQTMAANDWYPRRPTNCFTWRRPCPFIDVCENRDRSFLENYFVEKDPDPWESWITIDLDMGEAA